MASGARSCGQLAGGALRIRSDRAAGSKRPLVDLAQPDHTSAGGQPVAVPDPDLARLALRPRCDSPPGGRRDGAHPLPPRRPCRSAWPTISETCLPGEGAFLCAVGDVAPLGECRPGRRPPEIGPELPERELIVVDVGGRGCRDLYRIFTGNSACPSGDRVGPTRLPAPVPAGRPSAAVRADPYVVPAHRLPPSRGLSAWRL